MSETRSIFHVLSCDRDLFIVERVVCICSWWNIFLLVWRIQLNRIVANLYLLVVTSAAFLLAQISSVFQAKVDDWANCDCWHKRHQNNGQNGISSFSDNKLLDSFQPTERWKVVNVVSHASNWTLICDKTETLNVVNLFAFESRIDGILGNKSIDTQQVDFAGEIEAMLWVIIPWAFKSAKNFPLAAK